MRAPPAPTRQHLGIGLGLAFVLVATAAVLSAALSGPFLFDDFANLQNLRAFETGIDPASLGNYLHAFVGNPGRPLGALSFMIEDQAWPTDPGPYKRTNLLLHLAVGVLVFAFVRQLVPVRPGRATPDLLALLVTAIWLLHPMQVASTMLVVQRMNILATGFTLAGLSCYVSLAHRGKAALALTWLGVFAMLAFLCKENGVLAFAYAVVLNHTVLAPRLESNPPAQRWLVLGTWAPMLAVATGIAYQAQDLFASYQLRDFSLAERLMTEARVLAEYVARIVMPRLGGQGLFHDDYPVSTGLLAPWSTLPAILAWLVALVLGIAWRRRHAWVSMAVLWFLAGHLLESTVLPLELYFEHRNYLPMVGLLAGAVVLGSRVPERLAPTAAIAFAAWLALASGATLLNARAWGSELGLARVWHAENPGSLRAAQFLAKAYESAGAPDLARSVLVRTSLAHPRSAEPVFQLALFDCVHGRLPSATVSRLVAAARRARPSQGVDAAMRILRHEAGDDSCNGALSPDDWHRVADALLANPAYGGVGSLAGSLHYQKAVAAEEARHLDLAMREYDAAFGYLRDARIPQRQAVLLISAGLPAEAIRYLGISDAARAPWPKRIFSSIESDNARIRAAIEDTRAIGHGEK